MSKTNALSARDRIASLVDENSFVEIGATITKRSTDFNMQEKSVPADGVITGYGLVSGTPAYIYSQDASSLNGSIGEMHAKKIAHVYELAVKTGVPVIGLIDCAGMRLQESTDALAGFGQIYKMKAKASGIVPQISAVFGNCGGGVAVMTAMSDFTFMEAQNGKLFVSSPNTLEGNYTDKLDTASADFQKAASNVDVILEGETEVLNAIRELVSILPENNNDTAGSDECMDDLNRLVPDFAAEAADAALALEDMSDNNFFLELKAGYAKEMVTGFVCFDGMTVGAIANRTAVFDENGKEVEKFDGRLTTAGCEKAADFVKKCDAFNIPVLTLTNVEGYATSVEEETTIATAAAKLTAAFVEADVPKVNLIVGKAYGSAYITMNSKHIGADMVFALPTAQIGMMDANVAAKIMYADADAATIGEKAAEYASLQESVQSAAARGYVDTIISADDTRKYVIGAFEMLFTKREDRPAKKHGTV